jgi:hypothetical protein
MAATPSAQLQAVLANPVIFEELVAALQSSDNAIRNQAEEVFNELKEQPDACITLLVRLLRGSTKVDNRMFCAVMLRKVRGMKNMRAFKISLGKS